MGKVSVIVPAAGKGTRMGKDLNKQFLKLKGLPILVHTLSVFSMNDNIDQIIVVTSIDEVNHCREIIRKHKIDKISQVIPGGSERQHSVFKGLKCCDSNSEIVIIHDGARPLVTDELINDAINGARLHGAVSIAVPVKDTVKIVDEEGFVIETPERRKLWLIQTPQAFQFDIIKRAHEAAALENILGTDDASLVERLGHPVLLVNGSYENLKITTPEDLIIAEAILNRR